MLEGFAFLRTAPSLPATFLADILAMVFAQPRAVFPAVAGAFFGGVGTVGLLQSAVPDELRGRWQGVFIVVVASGPWLGDFVAGTTADRPRRQSPWSAAPASA
ncbi:hypothetical protein [Kribbella flavida]|uniref:hypothetical protein n=1 Tax=Kribbella flavida TaxID=182640 RepID=UPI00019BD9E4|nr:hypothetical protein [Kribbella flavida]